MVPKPGERRTGKLLHRRDRNEIFLVPVPLLVILALQSNSSSRHRSDIWRPILLVGLHCLFVFGIELFRVRFFSRQLLL